MKKSDIFVIWKLDSRASQSIREDQRELICRLLSEDKGASAVVKALGFPGILFYREKESLDKYQIYLVK